MVTFDLIESYRAFISSLPQPFGGFLNIFLLTIFVLFYSVFIWKAHKIIGTKNILQLNLNKYNTSKHPLFSKFFAVCFYFLEYIIIVPLIIFFWFAILCFFMILFTENLEATTIITISVVVIAAIRLAPYLPGYGETLSRKIAILLPLNLLAISLLSPEILDFSRVINQLDKIQGSVSLVFSYLLFIVVLEMLLRFFEFILDILGLGDI